MAPVVAALEAIPTAMGAMLPGASEAALSAAANAPFASKLIASRLLGGGGPRIEGGSPPPAPPLPSSPLSTQRRTSPFSSKPAGGELSPEVMEALISLLQRQSFPSR